MLNMELQPDRNPFELDLFGFVVKERDQRQSDRMLSHGLNDQVLNSGGLLLFARLAKLHSRLCALLGRPPRPTSWSP